MVWQDLIVIEENNLSNTGFFHFQVHGPQSTVSGHGTDPDNKLAKACHEYAERKAFMSYDNKINTERTGVTSNGFACHFSYEKACLAAENELFERDILISHWIEKISPIWLNEHELIKQSDNNTILLITKLKLLEFNFRIGILAFVNNRVVVIGTITQQDGQIGHAIATACSNSIPESIFKIFTDLVRVAVLLLGRKKNNLPLYHLINECDLQKPQDHLEYYLNPNSWTGLDWFFDSSSHVRHYNALRSTFYKKPSCSDLNWEHTVVQAVNNDLQNLFFGPTTIAKINSNRILNIENMKPHPLA